MENGQKQKIMEREALQMQAFPNNLVWFEDARGFKNLELGLKKVGFKEAEVNDILGNNWYNFYRGINS